MIDRPIGRIIDRPLDRIVSLERSARAAMPALEECSAGDWVCRISGGTTKRVNSANPVIPGADVDAVRAIAEGRYRAAGLPVRFRLTPLAAEGADAVLDRAGYAAVDASLTMVMEVRPRPIPSGVRILPCADDAWCAGLGRATQWNEEEDLAHRALMRRLPPGSAVALLDEGDGPIAFGGAGLGEGRVCLFDIAVMPAARGRGHGRRIVEGLLGWAAASGHREALLQVLATNDPARALYRSLGFVDAYPYHYRIAD